MTDGAELSVIKCKSVYMFNYNNTFGEDDGFACYVGEVTYEKIPHPELKHWLKEKRFGFLNADSSTYLPTQNDLFYFHIVSGDIDIDITCETIEKDGNILNAK